ncbi:MAG TPA: ribosome small subunit-dependent GTPase A [Opitutaceae bacterium]|nr:ribosome small subunit-dependent GTPase A [Opitutaceae bacterium]
MSLADLGWNDTFAAAFTPLAAPGVVPARVTADFGRGWGVTTADGEILAEPAGKLRHRSTKRAELPVAGDWVAVEPRADEPRARLLAVLPRRTVLSRQAAGHRRAEEQILAANLDTVFIVAGLDQPVNHRRIERFLTAVRSGGIAPVVVLNKADLHDDPAAERAAVERIAGGAPVVTASAQKRGGAKALKPWLVRRQTVAFLGTSGVGKSSLVNRLLGDEVQAVQEVREADAKGRHCTTSRELLVGPGGVLLLDTPGMREFQFWDLDTPLEELFPEIAAAAAECRFRDCRHGTEPGCAVQAGLAAGRLETGRVTSYLKLKAERALAATPWKKR